MEILQAVNLKKYYQSGDNTVKAVDDISFSIEKGSFTAIVGTSGSGKSTLLHMLGGLDTPTGGSVVVDGQSLGKMSRSELTIFRRRKIGFIFQDFNLHLSHELYMNFPDLLLPDDVKLRFLLFKLT